MLFWLLSRAGST